MKASYSSRNYAANAFNTAWGSGFAQRAGARSAGLSVPATDILIASCARHHQVELEHADSDFSHLEKL